MSYISSPHTTPLEHRTLFQLLDHNTSVSPNKEAIVFRDDGFNRNSYTFKKLKDQSQILAAKLIELGLERGDKVVFMLSSCWEFVVILTALNRIGAVAVVLDVTSYGFVASISDQVKYVFTDQTQDDVIGSLVRMRENDSSKSVVLVGTTRRYKMEGTIFYGDLLGDDKVDFEKLTKVEISVQFDDSCVVVFTSGSTGNPSPKEYTHHGFVNGILGEARMAGLSRDTILFSDAPFDWITGLANISYVLGTATTLVTFPPNLLFSNHVTTKVLRILEEERCTHATFLHYFLKDLTTCKELASFDLSFLKVCLTGGQSTDFDLLHKVLKVLPGLTIFIAYGSTEVFVCCSQSVDLASICRVDEVGKMKVSPGFEVKVVDSEGRLVPVDTAGELCVRGAAMVHSANPFNLPATSHRSPITATGWFHTSDWAAITSEGLVRILGRMDDVIKFATDSVQPKEVEEILCEHGAISDVKVVGVPDQRLFETICACVILSPRFQGSEKEAILELKEFAMQGIPVGSNGLSWVPQYYLCFESFPKTRTGKTDRKMLRKLAIEKLGL
ncbi:acyl-CoA ligase sidI-like [Nematostella vectensis]|uniref:acyl-CoA ligase sidI-like n=1 Tax=Nematostella vectensis TaxID=45351 RepID=UPI0020775F7A|nr:acyl-CoA ligase sidI-like [Nematostella vectensis]